ncbi:unnamed protein product [Mytilus coruscus]|uniref:Uncharacterized protein n=1 Tax=Mytilus coruscus TaxID=42192 RepID=A0A6J8BP24_MYTCO|nr:unnamed protein product [Mytilus coruscus]
MCDLVDNCNCRKRCNINKTDGLNSLTVLTEEESSDIKKFCQLIQWSKVECWETIKIEPYIKTLLVKVQPSIESHETEREEHSEGNEDTLDYDFLDVSLASLKISESQILENSLQSLGAAFSELDVSIESVEDDLFEVELHSFEEETPDNSTEIEDRTGIEEDMTDLTRALLNAELPFDPESFILEAEKRDIEDLHSVFHDESDNSDRNNSENNSEKTYPTLMEALNFKAYDAPSLLCRHPPPYTGRDDDESKLREILDDILIKSDQQQIYKDGQNRILFAPDHKIGKNLISLMKKCSKYQIFLPEFPILHLRKSRICNIFSGYKNAGLVHLLGYMRDDNTDEWSKLLSERCIDDATTVIWRLSLSLHLSFFLQFIMQLPSEKLKEIIKDMDDKNYNNLLSFWDNQLGDFIMHGTSRNATFTLHKEIMNHFDEVLAIAFSERLGGCKGNVSSEIENGTVLYATQAWHCKFWLGFSKRNGPSGCCKRISFWKSIKSIIPRMSIIDELGQAHLERNHIESKLRQKLPFSVIKNTDLKHVIPTAELILRRNGLETDVNIIPYNVYAKKNTMLSSALLGTTTSDIGRYLIQKFVASESLFGCSKEDLPKVEEIIGPKPLVDRVKKSKGTVICRTKFKQAFLDKTEKDIAEEKRVKKVTKLTKNLDHLSSTMNACQARVKPDCTKPKVLKAAGIQQALLGLLLKVVDNPDFQVDNISLDTVKEADYEKLSAAKLAWIRQKKSPPTEIMQSVKVATIEFAGVKFKCKVPSGTEYLNFVEKAVLKPTLGMLPKLKRLVVCEEKYSYTPDDLKAATREQRQKTRNSSIAHLKLSTELINEHKFQKEAITSTLEGKIQISTYLAKHADKLKLNNNITLDFDSEYILKAVNARMKAKSCQCKRYDVPLRCKYSEENGFESSEMLTSIHQTKGEAEMAQVDLIFEIEPELGSGEAVMSIVTSGDIDAVVIHLFFFIKTLAKKR